MPSAERRMQRPSFPFIRHSALDIRHSRPAPVVQWSGCPAFIRRMTGSIPSGSSDETFQRVAQFGSARASGARGRRFKSFHADVRVGGRTAMQRAVTPPTPRVTWGFKSLPTHLFCWLSVVRCLLFGCTCYAVNSNWRNARFQIGRGQVRSLHGVFPQRNNRRLTTDD